MTRTTLLASMTWGKRMRFLEQREAYWKGFRAGLATTGAALIGLSALVYYIVEIVKAVVR